VESGPVREIFYRPGHPYTQALLACDPARLDMVQRELPTIAGDVPNLMRISAGCVFRPRCPRAFAPCANQAPPDVAMEEGHRARCHLLASRADE
jgi:peptide/nickel transport system ATP-binding protein